MKHWTGILLALLCLLSGCARTPSGSVAELKQYVWTAALAGGGTLTLRFRGDDAALTMENGGEREVIEGACLADNASFVIFDDRAAQSYRFGYVPKGKRLVLTCGEGTVELTAEEGAGASADKK